MLFTTNKVNSIIANVLNALKRTAVCAAAGILFTMLLLLPLSSAFPSADREAYAVENTYTVQMIPSSDHVVPGETFQLYVNIVNDGWPEAGETAIAALQAMISFDREKVVCEDLAVNAGTIGQYDEETGLITGFGEKQSFDKDLDYAVLTMRMLDTAEGDVTFHLSDLVLGSAEGMELSAYPAPDIYVTAGTARSPVLYSGTGNGSLGAGSATLSGSKSGSSGTGASGSGSQNGGVSGGAAGAQGDSDETVNVPADGSDSGDNPDAGAPEDTSAAGGQTDGSSTEAADSGGRAANYYGSTNHKPLVAGIMAALVICSGAGWYYCKGRRKDREKQ